LENRAIFGGVEGQFSFCLSLYISMFILLLFREFLLTSCFKIKKSHLSFIASFISIPSDFSTLSLIIFASRLVRILGLDNFTSNISLTVPGRERKRKIIL